VTIEFIKTIILGLFAFVSTNLDDFLLLLMLFSTGTLSVRKIVLGQYLGMFGILILSCFGGSAGVTILSSEWIGLLGVLPLVMGLKKLSQIYWPKFAKTLSSFHSLYWNKNVFNIYFSRKPSAKVGVLAIAAMTLANGGDNVAVYSGLFSEKSNSDVLLLILIFSFLTAVWCLGGFFLSSRERWKNFILRFNVLATPYALITIGIFILLKLI
jgi:cadmium resistance protein CadD (predicted permease)